jgi:hypothetical protein
MRKRVKGVLVSQDAKKTYNVLLDLILNPITADERGDVLQWTVANRKLAPGHGAPDGNYTSQPHEYHAKVDKVRIERGEMLAGWL